MTPIEKALAVEARAPHGEITEIHMDGDEVNIFYIAPDNGRIYMATYGPEETVTQDGPVCNVKVNHEVYTLYAD